jgi:GMP synthase-like glutamine amidotransferase
MVFGGSMHPDQDESFDWLETETLFLENLLAEDVPTIGVCLGAQLLARAAGAEVKPAAEPEIGWCEIELTEAGYGDRVLGTLPRREAGFQWHHYTFELPDGAVELARSAVCTQAFRLGRAWGIQFHAEVTRPMIEAWTKEDTEELPVTRAELLRETDARIDAWNASGRRLCGAFLDAAAG